jgi:hypothetical protein
MLSSLSLISITEKNGPGHNVSRDPVGPLTLFYEVDEGRPPYHSIRPTLPAKGSSPFVIRIPLSNKYREEGQRPHLVADRHKSRSRPFHAT